LCIIGFFGILLIALLILPFSIFAKVERMGEKFGYQLAIRYPWKSFGFGMDRDAGQQRMRILIGNKSVYEKNKREGKKAKKYKSISAENESVSKEAKREKKKTKKKSKKEKSKTKFSDFVQIWQLLRGNIKPIIQFLKDILRCFRRARIVGDLEVGISDPALMGMLYGMYWAVLWNKQHNLKINPNFLDATFSGWVEFEIYITILPILFAFIKLAFRMPIIKIIRLVRQRKSTKKKTQKMEVK
jgi:hypothetical protein